MPDRILRQYAAIFFFAPLVRLRLRGGHDFGLSEWDKTLIRHSVRQGYITFALGVSFLVVSALRLLLDGVLLQYLYWILMGVTIVSLVIGVWYVHHPKTTDDAHTPLLTNHMLMAFLPGYNWYLRYTEQDHHKPYRWLKESILWRYVIMVCWLLPWWWWLGMIVLVGMIVRIIILAAGYDVIPASIKQALNRRYTHCASEWWAYASAWVARLRDQKEYTLLVHEHKHYYTHILPKKRQEWSWVDHISYGVYTVIITMLVWFGRGNSLTGLPTVFRGLLLLGVSSGIRWYYQWCGPIPFLSPLVEKIYYHFSS